MLVRISNDGHVIVPPSLLEAFGLGPDDVLELENTKDGFTLKPAKGHANAPPGPVGLSTLGALRDKMRTDMPPLDMGLFRECLYLDRAKYLEMYREKYPESGCDAANSRD